MSTRGDPRQAASFDEVAKLYDATRPVAPAEAVDALVERLALRAGAEVLEVGCGTGQFTGLLLARGLRVHAIDPGASLLEICRAKLPSQDLRLSQGGFEDFEDGGARYAAVLVCQAAHWIEIDVLLDGAARRLAAGAGLGLVWHLDRSEDTPFWKATQPLYDRYPPDAGDKPPRTLPVHFASYREALEQSADFADVQVGGWPWVRQFDVETYSRLLRTHSPVRLLNEADRDAFVAGHVEVIEDFGGQVDRHYETVVLTARRAGAP